MNEAEVRRIAAQEAALVVQAFYRVFANQLGGDVEAAGKAADALTEPDADVAQLMLPCATCGHFEVEHRSALLGRSCYLASCRCDRYTDLAPCQCICDTCTAGGHCDTASCAQPGDAMTVPAEVSVTPTPSVGLNVFAVMDVLAEHLPRPTGHGNAIFCQDRNSSVHLVCADWEQWHGHIAPLIAAACTPQPAGISAAGEMFPQSQKQQK